MNWYEFYKEEQKSQRRKEIAFGFLLILFAVGLFVELLLNIL